MAFLTGLVTGLASSVDDQLKKDMQRTQERIDGMAQYRVTRRRAALEAQEKEKKEIQDSINKLATLVGGDIDKAAQLYVSGGQTVDGANDLYKELKTNLDAGKNINSMLTFADVAEPGQVTDYLKQFVTPVSTLPISEDEAPAAGLYGALFKPDTTKKVMRQVEEAAPLGDQTREVFDTKGATIDRTQMLAAEEYQDVVTGRTRETERFDMEKKSFATQQKAAQANIRQADERLELARKQFDRDGDTLAWNKAKDMHAMTIADENLNLAVAREGRLAQESRLNQDLTKLSMREKELAIEKAEKAPEFADYEAMLVSADQELAELRANAANRTLTDAEKARMKIVSATYSAALKGLKAYETAKDTSTGTTGYQPKISSQTFDSIYNNEIKRQLEPIGLVEDIEGVLKYKIGGNELQYITGMNNALTATKVRLATNNDTLGISQFVQSQTTMVTDLADKYKTKMLKTEGFTPTNIDTSPNILQSLQKKKADGKPVDPNDPLDQIIEGAEQGIYEAGDIIQFKDDNNVTQYLLYTGNDLL